MRSSVPIPGNPWPHDMVITPPRTTRTRLLICSASGKPGICRQSGTIFPPSLSDESVSAHARTESADRVTMWRDSWPSIWDACVHHSGLLRDGAMFEQLRDTADGSPERAELKRAAVSESARRLIDTGTESFDFVFIDADKRSNPNTSEYRSNSPIQAA